MRSEKRARTKRARCECEYAAPDCDTNDSDLLVDFRYCHSFSAEAGRLEIPCIQEYENNITRWRSVIRDSFSLLEDIIKSIKDIAPFFENYVTHYDKVLHYMHLAVEVCTIQNQNNSDTHLIPISENEKKNENCTILIP